MYIRNTVLPLDLKIDSLEYSEHELKPALHGSRAVCVVEGIII